MGPQECIIDNFWMEETALGFARIELPRPYVFT